MCKILPKLTYTYVLNKIQGRPGFFVKIFLFFAFNIYEGQSFELSRHSQLHKKLHPNSIEEKY